MRWHLFEEGAKFLFQEFHDALVVGLLLVVQLMLQLIKLLLTVFLGNEFSIHQLWINDVLKLELPKNGEDFTTEHLPYIIIFILEISHLIKVRIVIIIRVKVRFTMGNLVLEGVLEDAAIVLHQACKLLLRHSVNWH